MSSSDIHLCFAHWAQTKFSSVFELSFQEDHSSFEIFDNVLAHLDILWGSVVMLTLGCVRVEKC